MLGLQIALVALAAGGSAGDTVLLDFTASWCGPCKQMAPVVEQLTAQGYPIRKVDIDQQRELAQQFGITAVPCFVMLVNGQEVDRVTGGATPQQLLAMLDKGKAHHEPSPLEQGPQSQGFGSAPQMPRQMPQASPSGQAPPQALNSTSFDPRQAQPAAAGGGELQQRLIEASVRLRINDGNGHSVGTGTIIDSRAGEALVLTCGHVFRDSQGQGTILVDLFGPEPVQGVQGQIISYDLDTDVALLSIRPGVPVTTARVAPPGYQVRVGDPVFNVGCNHGDTATLRASQVIEGAKILGPPKTQVTGQPVQGRSGGGLFSAEGYVIGVCNWADATDDRGFYAALASIQEELAEMQLADIFQPQAGSPISVASTPARSAPLAEVRPASFEVPAATTGSPQGSAVEGFAPGPAPAVLASSNNRNRGGGRPSHLGGSAADRLPPRGGTAPASAPAGQFASAPTAPAASPTQLLQRAEADGELDSAELVCIVRDKRNPAAAGQLIVLEQAPAELVDRLSQAAAAQRPGRLTSMHVQHPAGAAGTTNHRPVHTMADNPSAWRQSR